MGLFFKNFLETHTEIAFRVFVRSQKVRGNINDNAVIHSVGMYDRFVYLSGMD